MMYDYLPCITTCHVSSKKRAGEDLVLLSPTRRRLDDDITRPTIDQPPAEPDVLDANGQPPAKPQPTDAMVDDAGKDGPSRAYYKPSTVRDTLAL